VPGDRIPITRLTARLEGPAVLSSLTDAWGQARWETGYPVKLPLENADSVRRTCGSGPAPTALATGTHSPAIPLPYCATRGPAASTPPLHADAEPTEREYAARRYQVPPNGARTIAALLTLRDQVLKPLLAGIGAPKRGRKPSTWTTLDRHYEQLRLDMQLVFQDLGIAA
jgi:hypothetical protein